MNNEVRDDQKSDTSEPREYNGSIPALRNTIWVGKEDMPVLQGKQVPIKRVVIFDKVLWKGVREEENVPALEFELHVGLRYKKLDAETRHGLQSAFGASSKTWAGKKVEFYMGAVNANKGDKTGKGIRCKPAATQEATK